MIYITHITGSVAFISPLPILKVGEIIGAKLFGGLQFTGLEKGYFDEIPGVIISGGILGLQISIRQQYEDYNKDGTDYILEVVPIHIIRGDDGCSSCSLNLYLKSLFEKTFKDNKDVMPR